MLLFYHHGYCDVHKIISLALVASAILWANCIVSKVIHLRLMTCCWCLLFMRISSNCCYAIFILCIMDIIKLLKIELMQYQYVGWRCLIRLLMYYFWFAKKKAIMIKMLLVLAGDNTTSDMFILNYLDIIHVYMMMLVWWYQVNLT